MAIERFYIIKDGERDGPFDESYVRFLLENEEVGFDDYCETEDGERFRLGTMYEAVDELADEDEEGDQAPGEKPARRHSEPPSGAGRGARSGSIVYQGHPSYLRFSLSWLLVFGGAVAGYLIGPHSLWGMLACFGLASLAIFYIVLARASHLYLVTPRRIEAVHGLVAKDSTEIRVEDIRTINVRRSGIPGLLGVGTVEFSSTGDAIDVAFSNIWGARRLKKLVRQLQDEVEG